MSFDVFYQPCRFGTESVEFKDRDTGELRSEFSVKPLTPDDLKAVRAVLGSAAAPYSDGTYVVEFADGGTAEVFGGDDLETGCMAALRGDLTPELLQFLFALLKAADWIMLPAMEGNPAITALPGRAEGFADSFPEVICDSAEELGVVLSGGFEAWQEYRERVVFKANDTSGEN
jgi:hypothetical protein